MLDISTLLSEFRSRVLPTLYFTLAMTLQAPLHAQDLTAEDLFLGEFPVVLSATRLRQSLLDVPASMTVIGQREIALSGARDIPDLLRLVPGFHVGRITGGRSTVAHHGLSDEFARDMQVLIDGRSVYDPSYGGVPWFDLPLVMDDIERIEVIRGPNASTYGANAFSATINIITAPPSTTTGTHLRVSAGNEQALQTVASYSASSGKLDYRATVFYRQDTGFIDRHDDFDASSISLHGDYQLNSNDAISVKLGMTEATHQEGFEGDIAQPIRETENTYHFQSIKFSHIQDMDSEWSIHLYHNYAEINDDFETQLFSEILTQEGLPTVPWWLAWDDQRLKLGIGIASHRYDLEFQNTLKLASNWRFVWGLGGRYDAARSYGLFATNKSISRHQLRAFLSSEWKPYEDVTINLGAMYEKYEGLSPRVSPRLALNYHVTNNHSVRISAANAIRMPTLLENNVDYRARFQDESVFDYLSESPYKLGPETIRSYELGYVGLFPEQGLTIDLKFFREEIRDVLWAPTDRAYRVPTIVAANPVFGPTTQNAFIYWNQGYVNIRGWEFGALFKPTNRSYFRLSFSRSQAVGELVSRLNPTRFRPLNDKVPKTTWSYLLGYQFPQHIDVSLQYYKVGPLKWLGEGDNTSGFHRYDFRIAKTIKLNNSEAKISLIIQNIDDEYKDFQKENLSETKGFIELSLNF